MTAAPDRTPHVSARLAPRSPRGPGRASRPYAGLDGSQPAGTLTHPSSETARLRRLIEAQAVIASDLSLTDVLTRIIGAACELAGARYGALGAIGPDERIEQLVQTGYGADAADALPETFRPEGVGFLVVPVVAHGRTVGEIYLADPLQGAFTDDDRDLVSALAVTAGSAVVNARLYEQEQRNAEWSRSSHDITRALLAETDVDLVLEIVSHAMNAAGADTGVIALPDRDGTLRAVKTVGLGARRLHNWVFDPERSRLSAAMVAGGDLLRPDFTVVANPAFHNAENFGPVLVAPLSDAKGVRGSVLLLRTADRDPFTAGDLTHLTSFADQVALALELADARSDAARLRELQLRHQIAQDLSDNVIQRLFATGMGLHSLAAVKDMPTGAADRLARHVKDLDDTIDEVRERVFGLRNARDDQSPGPRFPRVGAAGGRDAQGYRDEAGVSR